MKKKIKLSIVTSLFHSEKYIEEFYRKIIESINEINIKDYELIFVNDASPDNSLKIVLELFKKYKKISIIDFSKNFGHHKALMTGLEKASGEYVFLIDVDLEENPDLLVYFWREIHKKENYNNVDLVYGILDKRRGGFFQRFLGNVFYKILLFLTDGEIPKNVLMARLMTQRYKNALVSHRDKNIFIPGLSAITGYTQLPLKCKKGTQVQVHILL